MVAKTHTCSVCEVTAIKTLGGPTITWRSGRTDTFDTSDIPEDGRLPSADSGEDGSDQDDIDHLRSVFYPMGFDDQEIVCLSGAHALGRCHERASGYSGPWTPTPTTFTNAYYILLRTLQWVPKVWDGPFQYVNARNGRLMMLPTDLALLEDATFSEWVDIYAEDAVRFFADFSAAFQKLTELGTVDLITTVWA
jgi:cytochrome c peroxidase